MSTKAKGDLFRDVLANLLEASGYAVQREVLIAGKLVDVFATKQVPFRGQSRLTIEAKDYDGNLPVAEVQAFIHEYGNLTRDGHADTATLVSTSDLTPHGKEAIAHAQANRLSHRTWNEFRREVFDAGQYMQALKREYAEAGIETYYIAPHTVDGTDLHALVHDWIYKEGAPPLVIFGGYGMGKSTFAQFLANELAIRYETDLGSRVPILVPLGEIEDENSLQGLFGKLFSAKYRIADYHYEAFTALNDLGHLLIIFDGLDEMKHGMTFGAFRRQCQMLFKLNVGRAKILILGRPNAFPSDQEFRTVIKGRITTAAGQEFQHPELPACLDVHLAPFTPDEALSFVERYFRWQAGKLSRTDAFVEERLLSLRAERFKELILRPVHAQMLCQVATDSEAVLDSMDEFLLYDRFIALLLHREVAKPGRYAQFDVDHRRRFNAAVSWWLMTKGGASSTTIHDVPLSLCRSAVAGVSHDLDDEGLRKELVAGCLIEKPGATVYFGHRSIQEFLAAEHIFSVEFGGGRSSGTLVSDVCQNATPEITKFLGEYFNRASDGMRRASVACDMLATFEGDLADGTLNCFVAAYRRTGTLDSAAPWHAILEFQATGKGAIQRLFTVFANRATDRDVWLLAAQKIATLVQANELAPVPVVAALIQGSTLPALISDARGTKQRITVTSTDPRTYCLLSSFVSLPTERAPNGIGFEPSQLARSARKILGYGFLSEPDTLAPPSDVPREIDPATVYRALKWNENKLDQIRPFFNSKPLREKMQLVEVISVNKRTTSNVATRPIT